MIKVARFFSFLLIFASSWNMFFGIKGDRPSFYRWNTQTTRWSVPQTIPGYNLDSRPPVLIADQNKTVHAFSSQWLNEDDDSKPVKAIMYNQWTIDNGWSEPTDVLLSPINEARITDAILDENGIIHLIFFGGNGENANIYYATAPAANAYSVRAWSNPILIGDIAADPENAVLVKDSQGNLIVVYYGRKDGKGIYVTTSNDNGDNWSEPVPFFLVTEDKPNIAAINVITSDSGWIHAIWAVYDISGQGRGIYYSRTQDPEDWSEPILLAKAESGLGTQTPTIVEYQDILYAIYNATPKITMRQSMDQGETWTDPITLFPRHVGVNGSLSAVVDGADNLHLFFGQRISGNPDIHGMWHSIWVNNHWIEPEAIVKGPRVIDKVGTNGFDPYDAQAIVSQGNVILVTWRTDPGDIKPNGVWYAYTQMDIPESPIIPLPTNQASITQSTLNSTPITATPTPVSTIQPILSGVAPYPPSDPAWLILIGIIPTVLLLVAIILFKVFKQSRN